MNTRLKIAIRFSLWPCLWLQIPFTLVELSAYAQQPSGGNVTFGVSRYSDQQPVPNALLTIMINGPGGRVVTNSTNSTGVLSISIQQNMAGRPTLIRVKDWVVVTPCAPPRGAFNMPCLGCQQPITVSPARGALSGSEIYTCSMTQWAYDFPRMKLPGQGAVSGQQIPKRHSVPKASLPALPDGSASLILSGYMPGARLFPEISPQVPLELDLSGEREKFLSEQSKELGISPTEIEKSIERWIKLAKTPYHRGLGALYEGHYREAVDYLSDAIDHLDPRDVTVIADARVCLAHAYYGLGNEDQAERFLELAKPRINPAALKFVANDLTIVEKSRTPRNGVRPEGHKAIGSVPPATAHPGEGEPESRKGGEAVNPGLQPSQALVPQTHAEEVSPASDEGRTGATSPEKDLPAKPEASSESKPSSGAERDDVKRSAANGTANETSTSAPVQTEDSSTTGGTASQSETSSESPHKKTHHKVEDCSGAGPDGTDAGQEKKKKEIMKKKRTTHREETSGSP